MGVLFLVEWQRGNLPAAFAIPGGVGDILVGISAPIVAFSLGKSGALGWAAALTWNALGLADLVFAVSVGTLAGPTFILNSYLFIIPALLVPIAVILHLSAIVLLTRGIRQRFRTI